MELEEYRKKIANLDVNEQKLRDLYLRKLSLGEIQGPNTGFASLDKPWLKYYNENAILTSIEDATLFQTICNKNINNRNLIALDYFGVKINYEQLINKIQKVIKLFTDMGIKERDPVTICLPNIPEFIYVFYALNELGADIQIIDPRTKTENINDFLNRNNTKLYITYDSNFCDSYDNTKSCNIENTLIISPFDSLPMGLKQLLKFKNRSNHYLSSRANKNIILWKNFISKKTKCQEIASSKNGTVILNTGGTTGKPKGVVLNNKAINGIALEYEIADFKFDAKDKIMFNIPNSLAYGLIISLHLPLTLGMHLQIVPQFDPEKYDELILKYKPNHIVGIPDWYQQMYTSEKLAKLDLSFIKTAASGGAPMSNTVKQCNNQFLKEHNSQCFTIEGYGMTEVGSSASTNLLNVNIPYSVGVPLVKNTISLFDLETGQELSYNQKGEICITGPTMMQEYYNNQKETDKILKDYNGCKWICTGDIGRINEDGVLFVEGRIKRIIETYTTHKIYSESVEELIMSNYKIESCAIISLPDVEHGRGYVAKAILKLYPEYELEKEKVIQEINELCVASLEEFSVPCDYEIVEKMPFTNNGKINYKLLEEEARQNVTEKVKKRIK